MTSTVFMRCNVPTRASRSSSFRSAWGDTEEVFPTRTELGALVRLVNEELQRRIEAADATTQSLRAALGEDGVQ